MKTVYIVSKDSVEIYRQDLERFGLSPWQNIPADRIFDLYDRKFNKYPEELARFDTLDEAKAYLATVDVSTERTSFVTGTGLIADVAMLEEVTCDENGEVVDFDGTWDTKAQPLTVDEDEDIGE